GAGTDCAVLHLAGSVDERVTGYLYREHAGRAGLARAGAGSRRALSAFHLVGTTGARTGCGPAVDRTLPLHGSARGCARKADR
nr:hypothetical protein [Tanacetum cinerariifolium]